MDATTAVSVRDYRFACCLCTCAALFLLDLIAIAPAPMAATWRVGDREQPWRLHPVSFALNIGPGFKPDYLWGGPHAVEVVVDDDGDGLVDEDPVDFIDDDGDRLFNEDPSNGDDDDRDGLVDEDGPDPQLDNDGDGLLNEDGLMTGGPIFDSKLGQDYRLTPFFRDPPEFGDDDQDAHVKLTGMSAFNEDPVNGKDDDGDGLVDEDDRSPPLPLPASWTRQVYGYDAAQVPEIDERQTLRFAYDPLESVYRAVRADGGVVEARLASRRFSPTDWLRPIRLDSTRNLVRLTDDRFLSGEFGPADPLGGGSTPRTSDSGLGQTFDGNLFTAKTHVQARAHSALFRGLFWVDRLRFYPRPDFPDRTLHSFRVYFGGDHPRDFRSTPRSGTVLLDLVAYRFLIPAQIDQTRPVIKDFAIDPSQRVRLLYISPAGMREGEQWELAEMEAYGHGYALDAAYVTEIIDVGSRQPRFRRYAEPGDPSRPMAFEAFNTADDDRDGRIDPGELASAELARQFDPLEPGRPVNWGQVRWKGELRGEGGNVLVRVRAGNVLDTHIYHRQVGRGVISPFIGQPIVLDWPAQGSRIDATAYVAFGGLERAPLSLLPYNTFSENDGAEGGWSFWSAPIDFEDGLIDENGEGGVSLSLPPLTRYIQFRFDFASTEDSGVRLDYIEFDYSPPAVGRGVLAEIFPDTVSQLGTAVPFLYVLKPQFVDAADSGFDRIDIAVPSLESRVDSFVVDDRAWAPLDSTRGLTDPDWLDGLSLAAGSFASAVYRDSASGQAVLGIKTPSIGTEEFPPGQERDIRIYFRAPVFSLLTEFTSQVWDDSQDSGLLPQRTQEGDAAEYLPADRVQVTASAAGRIMKVGSVAPNPFTPNGDGINDEVEFRFALFLLMNQSRAVVEIFDLAGKSVRRLEIHPERAGPQQLTWDGRDEAGGLVLPGLYLYRISVASDAGSNERAGAVAVAY